MLFNSPAIIRFSKVSSRYRVSIVWIHTHACLHSHVHPCVSVLVCIHLCVCVCVHGFYSGSIYMLHLLFCVCNHSWAGTFSSPWLLWRIQACGLVDDPTFWMRFRLKHCFGNVTMDMLLLSPSVRGRVLGSPTLAEADLILGPSLVPTSSSAGEANK